MLKLITVATVALLGVTSGKNDLKKRSKIPSKFMRSVSDKEFAELLNL